MARLRMIAGPNGSGKTTLTNFLRSNFEFDFGYYINADDIESILATNNKIECKRFGIRITAAGFENFYKQHPLRSEDVFFSISQNALYLKKPLQNFSYFAALFADYIRRELIKAEKTFSFETVMSGKDKIELLKKAMEEGYRVYLYYISTDDVIINKSRVINRIDKGGHNVPENKVEDRYYRSLNYLLDAIKLSDRAYLFDNSGTEHKLVAEITNGRDIEFDPSFVPAWFEKYVLQRLDV